MKNQDTICFDITQSIKQIEKTIATGGLNAGILSKRLHNIRIKAQRMENALKIRKKIMIDEGLEEKYKKARGEKYKPTGLNKIANDKEERHKYQIDFDVTVKKAGEIVYQNKVKAGVLCFVEKISDMDEFGQVDSTTQKLSFGHPLASFTAFDQLSQHMESRIVEIRGIMQEAVLGGKLDPEFRKQMVESLQTANIESKK